MDINKIAELLNISIEQANQVRQIIKGRLDPLSFKSVQSWVDQCFNMPSKLELKLCAINEVIGGFGVEYTESVNDSYTDKQGLDYINLGDTYTCTVVFNHSTNKFSCTSWGDIVEANSDEYI